MSQTNSYSNVNTIDSEIARIGRSLDKFAKFSWRGEDMWDTYHTFITSNGSDLKFVNGPSYSNEYSSPQYDHAAGNLTGVKFSRMQLTFSICTYGVTAKQYRQLIAALGPYEIDYLALAYDSTWCYLAKTTGLKEGIKTIVGTKNGESVYMVENTVTFEIQGEQCAIAQYQYVWKPVQLSNPLPDPLPTNYALNLPSNNTDYPAESELPFGVVSTISVQCINTNTNVDGTARLYIGPKVDEQHPFNLNNFDMICEVKFNTQSLNWQNTENTNNNDPTFNPQDRTLSIKYDSASGLVFLAYGETDYKILNLLSTNTYGDLLVKDIQSKKIKIDKNEIVAGIQFYWILDNLDPLIQNYIPVMNVYGRAKAILV